jgi:hypothetical protein
MLDIIKRILFLSVLTLALSTGESVAIELTSSANSRFGSGNTTLGSAGVSGFNLPDDGTTGVQLAINSNLAVAAIGSANLSSNAVGAASAWIGASVIDAPSGGGGTAWNLIGGSKVKFFDDIDVTSATLSAGTPVQIQFSLEIAGSFFVDHSAVPGSMTSNNAFAIGSVDVATFVQNRTADRFDLDPNLNKAIRDSTGIIVDQNLGLFDPNTPHLDYNFEAEVGDVLAFVVEINVRTDGHLTPKSVNDVLQNMTGEAFGSIGLSFGATPLDADVTLMSARYQDSFPAASLANATNALIGMPVNPVTPVHSSDFDQDGDVDSDDLIMWHGAYGMNTLADADGDSDSDGRDFLEWQRQYGSGVGPLAASTAVPEPTVIGLVAGGVAALMMLRGQQRHVVSVSLLLAALAFAKPALAVDYFWDGSVDYNFRDIHNWTPVGFPNDATDRAIFNLASTYDVAFVLASDITLVNNRLEVRAGHVTLYLSEFNDGVTYVLQPTVPGAVVANIGVTSGVPATLTVLGTNDDLLEDYAVVDAQGPLQLATVAGSVGVLNIGNSVRSGKWISSGISTIGSAGVGTLSVAQDSVLIDAGAVLGGLFSGTGVGTVNIQGEWINNGNLNVGNFGSGTLNIFGVQGYVETSGNALVARTAGETGSVTLSDSGTWLVDGTLAVGGSTGSSGGAGSLNLNGHAVLIEAGALTVWDPGVVNITDGDLRVTGALTLQSGSNLNLAGGHLRTSAATFTVAPSTFGWSSGTLELTSAFNLDAGQVLGSSLTVGANKKLIVAGGLNVGPTGGGILTISGGGSVESASATIGSLSPTSTTATVNMTGTGSTWDVTGALMIAGDNAATLSVNGTVLNCGSTTAAHAVGSTANIDLAGASAQLNVAADAFLGGGILSPGGAGTLDVTAGAKMTVGGLLTVWGPFTVTLNNSTIETQHLSVQGEINAQGTSQLTVAGSASLSNGASLVINPTSTFTAVGATVNLASGATLDANMTGDSATSVALSSPGTTWNMSGPLEVGAISAGPGRIGSLTLQTGAVVDVGQGVVSHEATNFTLAGGTLNAVSFDAGDEDLIGYGAINAEFSTTGSITATGPLTLGDANSFNGVIINGNLNVGAHTVTINKRGFFNVGSSTAITGGVLNAPGGVAIPSAAGLLASGSINASIAAQAGSVIEAAGDLVLGDLTTPDGYFSDGRLHVSKYTVTIKDANDAVLGSLATLGDSGTPGALVATNGVTLEFGKNITGFGTVDTPDHPATPLINNGHITGNSPAEPITLTGYVKGVGTLDNVVITGTDAPGFSPATVMRGSVVYNGNLEIEIGSTSPGSFDRIHHILGAGVADLGGRLDVSLIDGFVPAMGDTFNVLSAAGGVNGTFAALMQPAAMPAGLIFDVNYLGTIVQLEVVSVPTFTADFDHDGDVDGDDLDDWQAAYGMNILADADDDGDSDGRDFLAWQRQYTGPGSLVEVISVPEPTSLLLISLLILMPRRVG